MLEKLKSKSLYYFPWPVGTNDRLMKKDFGTFQKVLIGFVNFSVVPKMLCASSRGHRDCCGYILLVRCEIWIPNWPPNIIHHSCVQTDTSVAANKNEIHFVCGCQLYKVSFVLFAMPFAWPLFVSRFFFFLFLYWCFVVWNIHGTHFISAPELIRKIRGQVEIFVIIAVGSRLAGYSGGARLAIKLG